MVTDLLHILLAMAALLLPLLFAWYALTRTARRHSGRHRRPQPGPQALHRLQRRQHPTIQPAGKRERRAPAVSTEKADTWLR
jgi:hypothetical protein